MKNDKGNKHVKKQPYMTLGESLKDYYHVILERDRKDKSFQYIICDDKDCVAHIDDAEAMLHGCIFRNEKDAETFLDKMIRNNGFLNKEDFKYEKSHYRVMSVEELFMEHRLENEEREFDRNERHNQN